MKNMGDILIETDVDSILNEMQENRIARDTIQIGYNQELYQYLEENYLIYNLENVNKNSEILLDVLTEVKGISHKNTERVANLWEKLYSTYLEGIFEIVDFSESTGKNYIYNIPELHASDARKQIMVCGRFYPVIWRQEAEDYI